jgi:signal transduction histidine kinase
MTGMLPLLTPESLVPRIGDHLVERGVISSDQLLSALNHQKALRSRGEQAPLLGQLLIEMGFIDKKSLDRSITEQILQLRSALQEANAQLELRVQQRTAELEDALQKLGEMNKLKANFVSNISHELRTPMTHLKGYLELLDAGDLGEVTEDQRLALDVMLHSTDRLGRLIEDLILFSMSESGPISLRRMPFPLQRCLARVISTAKARAEETLTIFSTDIPDNLPMVEADEEKLNWTINQLLDNAFKFTPEGGKVKLRVALAGTSVSIAIMDTGIGMPGDKLEEIFEPFRQLDGSSTRHFGGTGLGLSLVKKIMDAHDIIIHVSSQPGQGSMFQFMLPVASSS